MCSKRDNVHPVSQKFFVDLCSRHRGECSRPMAGESTEEIGTYAEFS